MTNSKTPYSLLRRLKGPDPVVHLRDHIGSAQLAVCGGRFAASSMNPNYDPDAVPTCFWCVAGRDGSSLIWFTWGDIGLTGETST
jgi:hypothetical protein